MREKFARFMMGRYGNDHYNRFLSILSLVLVVLALILRNTYAGSVLWLLAIASLVYVYYRMFSRNVYKRADENTAYMRKKYAVQNWARLRKERWVQRKDYKFFKCPLCHTTLRVPRHKGKINIVCRKCGNSFQGKT